MRDSAGRPLTPGDAMPGGMCQPPVNAMALIGRLSPEEMNRALRLVAVWAPELIELGLQRVSESRAIAAEVERERAAAGLCPCGEGPAGDCPGSWHGCDWHDEGPEPEEYDPGPEVDDEGGMSKYRYAALPVEEEL
jgi:hypothetical protein